MLAPLEVRDGVGVHVEPNVWLRHSRLIPPFTEPSPPFGRTATRKPAAGGEPWCRGIRDPGAPGQRPAHDPAAAARRAVVARARRRPRRRPARRRSRRRPRRRFGTCIRARARAGGRHAARRRAKCFPPATPSAREFVQALRPYLTPDLGLLVLRTCARRDSAGCARASRRRFSSTAAADRDGRAHDRSSSRRRDQRAHRRRTRARGACRAVDGQRHAPHGGADRARRRRPRHRRAGACPRGFEVVWLRSPPRHPRPSVSWAVRLGRCAARSVRRARARRALRRHPVARRSRPPEGRLRVVHGTSL